MEIGKKNINILMLGVSYKNVAYPLMFKMLDKRGNSPTLERIALIQNFIDWYGKILHRFLNTKSDPIRDSLQSITDNKEENSLLHQLQSDNFFVKFETKTLEILKNKKGIQDAEFIGANVLEETKKDSLIDEKR